MKREELALRLIHACTDVIMAEEELTALDARLGDGDLGEGRKGRGGKQVVEVGHQSHLIANRFKYSL